MTPDECRTAAGIYHRQVTAAVLRVPDCPEDKRWGLGRQIGAMDREAVLPLLAQALEYEDVRAYRELLDRRGAKLGERRWWLAR